MREPSSLEQEPPQERLHAPTAVFQAANRRERLDRLNRHQEEAASFFAFKFEQMEVSTANANAM